LIHWRDMARRNIDFDSVRKIGLKFAGVEESTTRGAFALKACGKLLTCQPIHKSAEPDSLAVRIDLDQRAALLAEAPDIYYVTDHYVPYPMVLVRMSHITRDALHDLLSSAYRFVTSKTPRR
jgi:hypothetical protein